MTQYIEMDSTYRNRVAYPNPAQFVAEMSQSGKKNNVSALDPTSNNAPINYWNSSFREDAAAGVVAFDGFDAYTTGLNDATTFVITSSTQEFRSQSNFYVGSTLLMEDKSNQIFRSRITKSTRLAAGTLLVTVENDIPANFPDPAGGVGINSGNIYATNIATNAGDQPIMFVPSAPSIADYYVGMYVHNINTGESVLITGFDEITHVISLATTTNVDWDPGVNVYNFVIREEVPGHNGTLTGVSSNGRIVQLASTASNQNGVYIGSYLRMLEPIPTASNYSNPTAPFAQDRRIVSYLAEDGTFAAHGGIGTNTFTLGSSASSVDSYYVNAFITDTTTGETRYIDTYNGTTKSGTVTSNWGAGAAGDSYVFRTAVLQTAFSTNPVVGGADNYEIEFFTVDNYNPFVNRGYSHDQACDYDVRLLSLTLPNKVLSTGYGGRLNSYPYVYVELDNVSSPNSNTAFISNNPHSTSATFKATIRDTPFTSVSNFIKINGDGMTRRMKFKPKDNMMLSIRLPNGELFTTSTTDNSAPVRPNELLQISAMFSFRQV